MKTKLTYLHFLTVFLFISCNGQKKTTTKMNNNLSSISGVVEEVELISNKSYIVTISGFKTTKIYVDAINLKHPASFTILKKGEEVVIVYRSYMIPDIYLGRPQINSSPTLKMNAQEFRFIKSKEEFDKICNASLSKDAMRIENNVEFKTNKDTTLLTFTLRITNLTNRFIPALTPINNGRLLNTETGERVTEFMINNTSRGLSIYNGISQENETLNKGGVSETSQSYTLTENSNFDSDIITIQWKYKGILSKKVRVDVKKQVIIE